MQKITFPDTLSPEFVSYMRSFYRTLTAQNRSEKTIKLYILTLRIFGEYLREQGMPQAIESINREYIESFITSQLQNHKPNTALSYYRNLNVFFNWLVEEGEIKESPMRKMHAPKAPENPPEVLTEDQLKTILATCSGKDYFDRRDTAILRILIDTGMRRTEITNLTLSDIDWDLAVLRVQRAKGGSMKICPLGRKAVVALDRYIRIRAREAPANEQALWWGNKGVMTDFGIYNVVVQRCKQAGIPNAFTHLFRHTFAHEWLVAGGSEGDLARLGGWRSFQTMRRYGASAADSRARESHRNLSPGDRI